MLGAIIGDVIGSVYEFDNIKSTSFPLFSENSKFTDDTVLTIATADCLLNGKNYAETYKTYGRKYTDAGYGGSFLNWLMSNDLNCYNSFGNGSAMRVSPVGFAFNNMIDVLAEAKRSAEVTHNHPEGIKGAQATAVAIYLARNNAAKQDIREIIESEFKYDLGRVIDDIRPSYSFDETCQGSVPEAIIAFLESTDFESAIRLAISIGGDSDTIACITGGIAQAFYKSIPISMVKGIKGYLPTEFMDIVESFNNKFGVMY